MKNFFMPAISARRSALLLFFLTALVANAQIAGAPDDPTAEPAPEPQTTPSELSTPTLPSEPPPPKDPASLLTVPATSPTIDLAPNLPTTLYTGGDMPPLGQTMPLFNVAPIGEEAPNPNAAAATSFVLPMGYGLSTIQLPLGPAGGSRRPFSLSSSFQIGYDDNIFSSSGRPGQTRVIPGRVELQTIGPVQLAVVIPRTTVEDNAAQPKQGSLVSVATVGGEVALSTPRSFLYLSSRIGATATWESEENPIAPSGDLGLYFAHDISERMTLSGLVTSTVSSQQNATTSTSSTRDSTNNYLNGSANTSLSYRLSARLTSVSSFISTFQRFLSSDSSGDNYFEPGVAQAFQYAWSRRLILLVESRATAALYDNGDENRRTQYFLGGADYLLNERLRTSVRLGVGFQQYSQPGASDAALPAAEANVSYLLPFRLTLAFTNRYGFELPTSANERQVTFRSGLALIKTFTGRLTGTASVTYANTEIETLDNTPGETENSVDAALGLEYRLTTRTALFTNYTRSQVFATEANSYARNQVFAGVTLTF